MKAYMELILLDLYRYYFLRIEPLYVTRKNYVIGLFVLVLNEDYDLV